MKFAMKWVVLFSFIIFTLAGAVRGAIADDDKATFQEIKANCEEAAKYLSEKGEDGLPEFCDPKGKWAWKDSYVFVYDLDATVVAHSNPPTLVGKNLMGLKDIKGNMFAADFVSIAKSEKGKGWSEYWWPKAQAQEVSLKVSYIMKVPGKNWLVGAGIYDVSKADAIKIAGE